MEGFWWDTLVAVYRERDVGVGWSRGDEGTVDGRCQEFWRWVFSGREGGYADYPGEFTVCRGKPSRDGAVMKKKTGRVNRGKVEGGAGVGIGYIACGWEVGRGVSTCVRVVSRWVNGR